MGLGKINPGAIEKVRLKNGRKLVLGLAVAMAMVLLLGALVIDEKNEGAIDTNKQAYTLLGDYTNYQAVLKDINGTEVAKEDFPYPSSYLKYSASTPKGAALLSVGSGDQERFFFVNLKEKVELSEAVNKVLVGALLVDGRHNIAFLDEEVVIYVACPIEKTCVLNRLNLKTGKNDTIVDSGVNSSQFSPVYLLDSASDKKSAYVRVMGQNKLGSETSAVYRVDLVSKKATSVMELPLETGRTLSLSPDKTKLVYTTAGLGKNIEFHIFDLISRKTIKITWQKGEVANGTESLLWAPDSNKVLFGSSASIARATTASDNPFKLAYLDIKKSNVVELRTIEKTYLTKITYYHWSDKDSIIFQQMTMPKENDFANAKMEIFKQDLDSRETTIMDTSMKLEQVIYL